MAHLTRCIADTVLVRGYYVTGANLAAIDQNIYKAINGDEGGTWSPSTLIDIGGAGMIVAGPWELRTASVSMLTSANNPITFGRGTSGDYFGLDAGHPGRTVTILHHLLDATSLDPTSFELLNGDLVTLITGARFMVEIPVYGNATKLDSVTVQFKVGEAHANPPQYTSKWRVFAVSSEGDVIPLHTQNSSTDADGFQFFSQPATGGDWDNANVPYSITYTTDVTLGVDLSEYVFYVEIIDESGTNSWVSVTNTYYSLTMVFSNVTIFDGRN